MASACAICRAPVAPEAAQCSNCGARFDPVGKVDLLVDGLDELTRSLKSNPRGDHMKDVSLALGELEAVQVGLAKGEPRHADLGEFVRRVAGSGRGPGATVGPPPRRDGRGAPVVAGGALLAATGLFLTYSDPLVGLFTLLVGIGATAIGSVLYALRPISA